VRVVGELLGREGQREIDLRAEAIGGAGGEDPDHGVRPPVDADVAADEVAVAAEPLLPHAVGEDDDVLPAGHALLRQKVAAEEHGVARHGQEPRRRDMGTHLLGRAAAGQADVAAGPGAEVLE
jgi:hypothetical protein